MKQNMNVRRTLALLLTAALLLGMLVIPASATGFSDVSSTASYLDAVNYVSDNGIMTGTSSTKFSPSTTATRAMFVTVLYRKAGSPEPSQSASFSDVVSTAYYANAVAWAQHDSKIVSGTSSSLFSPNDSITREAAIVMLYRYASNVCNYDVSIDELDTAQVSAYSDYSSVSNYAINAITWAVAAGILLGTSSTTLSPKAVVTRAQIATFITRFGTNVDGVVEEIDNFNFNNSSDSTPGFTNSCYYISDVHYQRLKNNAKAYYIAESSDYLTKIIKFSDRIDASREKEWSGSCYGMATVVALDKTGQIAFNENYYPTAETMYDVKFSRSGNVESAINYYQLSQNIGSFMRGDAYETNILKAASACQANSGLSLVSYFWSETEDGEPVTHGHSVVVDTVTESSTNVYTFTGYNPNKRQSNTFTITSGGLLKNATESIQLTNIQVLTDLSVLDIIDIDYFENCDDLITTSATSTVKTEATTAIDSDSQNSSGGAVDNAQNLQSYDLNNTSLLTVKLINTFKITNAEGEYLYWDGEHLIGSMEVYSKNMTIEGETTASNLEIEVPWSNSFSFVPDAVSSDNWFSVTDSSYYARVSGENIEQILIDESGYIELAGNRMKYEVAYSDGLEDASFYTLSGTDSESITLTNDNNSLIVSGLLGLCTVKVTSTVDWASVCTEFIAEKNLDLIICKTSENQIAITPVEGVAIQ